MGLNFRRKASWPLQLCVAGLSAALLGQARARDAGAGPADAGAPARAGAPAGDARPAQIRALLAGTLDVSVSPQSLFDVSLADETAIRVERERLETISRTLDAEVWRQQAGPAPAPYHDAWHVRSTLDHARLDFLALPAERRSELLAAHEARRVAARPKPTPAQQRALEAERDRQGALAAARQARSEAERLVAETTAGLFALEQSIDDARGALAKQRAAWAARRDVVLGWQRRVRDAKEEGSASADATYVALRRALSASRAELAAALDELDSASSMLPPLGPDPLTELPPELVGEPARQHRERVARLLAEASEEERAVREERAASLLAEISALNHERLGLLAHLSEGAREAVTGFTEAGLDQARAEMRHLLLILRYHRRELVDMARGLRHGRAVRDASLWKTALVAVPWLFALAVFVWWRHRSPVLLTMAEARLVQLNREQRRSTRGWGLELVTFAKKVHRALEWLAFFAASLWLLPASARGLLEVQLLTVMVGWTLGGALLVNAIDAMASRGDASARPAAEGTAQLRLRSLRLVGYVIVLFALVLVISARLVGQGTVHHWVTAMCWFAVVPVFLTLVRWWRATVFERLGRIRRKSPVQQWVLANRQGWRSFFAAMIAAVQIFSLGTLKAVRRWVAGFDLARRTHAYLFKRELERLASDRAAAPGRSLSPRALASLHPARAASAWLPCPAEDSLRALEARLVAGNGGLIAVVGQRGSGKSTLLRELGARAGGPAHVLSCRDLGDVSLREAFGLAAPSEPDDTAGPPAPVLLDDVEALIRPVIGGLARFDELLSLARAQGPRALWVLAIDSIAWPFLTRARDARPLFDGTLSVGPWSDEQIGVLLSRRSAEAGITPVFEGLLERLPASADEIDKLEALAAKRAGYFRMVWDYARGNPALALEVWRSSLVEEAEGRALVSPLHAPHAAELEALPDAGLFVLRAVLQMAPASIADVVEATRLTELQVQDAFGFGRAHGYLSAENGKVSVGWAWLRAVMLLLERRHLVVEA